MLNLIKGVRQPKNRYTAQVLETIKVNIQNRDNSDGGAREGQTFQRHTYEFPTPPFSARIAARARIKRQKDLRHDMQEGVRQQRATLLNNTSYYREENGEKVLNEQGERELSNRTNRLKAELEKVGLHSEEMSLSQERKNTKKTVTVLSKQPFSETNKPKKAVIFNHGLGASSKETLEHMPPLLEELAANIDEHTIFVFASRKGSPKKTAQDTLKLLAEEYGGKEGEPLNVALVGFSGGCIANLQYAVEGNKINGVNITQAHHLSPVHAPDLEARTPLARIASALSGYRFEIRFPFLRKARKALPAEQQYVYHDKGDTYFPDKNKLITNFELDPNDRENYFFTSNRNTSEECHDAPLEMPEVGELVLKRIKEAFGETPEPLLRTTDLLKDEEETEPVVVGTQMNGNSNMRGVLFTDTDNAKQAEDESSQKSDGSEMTHISFGTRHSESPQLAVSSLTKNLDLVRDLLPDNEDQSCESDAEGDVPLSRPGPSYGIMSDYEEERLTFQSAYSYGIPSDTRSEENASVFHSDADLDSFSKAESY